MSASRVHSDLGLDGRLLRQARPFSPCARRSIGAINPETRNDK